MSVSGVSGGSSVAANGMFRRWMGALAWVFFCAPGLAAFGQAPGAASAPAAPGQAVQEPAAAAPSDNAAARQAARKRDQERLNEFHHFLRVRRDAKKKPVAMETSITRYIGQNSRGEPVSVDLIGVVHVGEPEYYARLNAIFEAYDCLLYELVAPEGTRIPAGGRDAAEGMNPVAALQMGMKSVLGLEFQLDHIDYQRSNFVHADMSPDEFLESMKNNDESIGGMFLRALGSSMAMQQNSGRSADADLMMALFSSNRTLAMRRAMADQMQNMEASMAIFRGKSGSTIIDHRNAKALSVLRREMDEGKKKLALFYGAGHLPDMQRRLQDEFGMQRAGQYWLTAWRLTDR